MILARWNSHNTPGCLVFSQNASINRGNDSTAGDKTQELWSRALKLLAPLVCPPPPPVAVPSLIYQRQYRGICGNSHNKSPLLSTVFFPDVYKSNGGRFLIAIHQKNGKWGHLLNRHERKMCNHTAYKC